MITDARALVRNVIAVCAVDPPYGFEWFGHRISVVVGKQAKSEAKQTFRRALATHLYIHFYTRGEATTLQTPERIFSGGEVRALQTAHALANPDRNRWDTGWTFVGRAQKGSLVRKGGIEFTVSGEGIRPLGPTLRSGSSVQVLVPAERWYRSPGYMLFYGRRVPRPRSAGVQRTRLYLDLDVEGARRVIGLCRRFNDAGLPFALKVAGHPAVYPRCDTVILFVERNDYTRVSEILVGAATELGAALRPGTPAFTKRVATGLAISDDPPGEESFGESRCRLLAEGIVRAHDSAAATMESRLREIEESFLREGIDLDRPHLEPDSPEYDLEPWTYWPDVS